MQPIANQLRKIIDEHIATLRLIPEDRFSARPGPAKWSKKESMGHLVDSAQNNLRRFVTAQYEDTPYIVYQQDKWVEIINYQTWNSQQVVELWYLLNVQICAVLENTPAHMAARECRTQEVHSIEWLANDYVKHLLHHLHVVLELEDVAYP